MDDDRKFMGMRKGLVRERGKNVIKKMKYANKDRLELNVIGIRRSRYVYLKYCKIHENEFTDEPLPPIPDFSTLNEYLELSNDQHISWKLLRKNQYRMKIGMFNELEVKRIAYWFR